MADGDRSIFSFVRKRKDRKKNLLFVCNFTPVERGDYAVGVPVRGKYKVVLEYSEPAKREKKVEVKEEKPVKVAKSAKTTKSTAATKATKDAKTTKASKEATSVKATKKTTKTVKESTTKKKTTVKK